MLAAHQPAPGRSQDFDLGSVRTSDLQRAWDILQPYFMMQIPVQN